MRPLTTAVILSASVGPICPAEPPPARSAGAYCRGAAPDQAVGGASEFAGGRDRLRHGISAAFPDRRPSRTTVQGCLAMTARRHWELGPCRVHSCRSSIRWDGRPSVDVARHSHLSAEITEEIVDLRRAVCSFSPKSPHGIPDTDWLFNNASSDCRYLIRQSLLPVPSRSAEGHVSAG